MKTLFLFFLSCIIWFYSSYYWNKAFTPTADIQSHVLEHGSMEIFPLPNDAHWDYMNDFKRKYSQEDLNCLRKNIFFEAASEPLLGKIAVAYTTLNRVKRPEFPNSICDVVRQAEYDERGNPIRYRCQFSWYCDGLPDRPDLSNAYTRRAWEEIGELVNEIIEGNYENPVGRSVFYHSKKVNPFWASENFRHSEIGEHIFYTASL